MRAGVVIPAHNAASFILDAIFSVRSQTVPDWHVVVVDDGSTDATPSLLAPLADPRITTVRQPNAGVSAARNAGVAALPPVDAVLFLDADDRPAPDALDRLRAGLRGDAGLVYGAFAFVRALDQRTVRIKRPRLGRDALRAMLDRNHFANGGHLLIRRDALNRAGPFRTDLRFGEDYEHWIRLALQGPFASVPGPPVLFVRQRDDDAYLRAAHESSAHAGYVDAIFQQTELAARLGKNLPHARKRMVAEAAWIIGRARLARGDASGLHDLASSVAAKPSARRAALLAALFVLSRRRRVRVPRPAPSRIPPAR